jgi:thiosulfate/3-mercaptopyruvate sulfurtransferase
MNYPLPIEPETLAGHLNDAGLRIIDLSQAENYARQHIPGAVHIEYGQIVAAQPPVMGLLPDASSFSSVLQTAGVDAGTHIVACDDEGGGRAARLLWTLEAYGHHDYSLLNGGLIAWLNEGYPVEHAVPQLEPTRYELRYEGANVADREYILNHLGDPDIALLDARSAGEYAGTDVRAARPGHIPGARHLEWTQHMDRGRNLRLLPAEQLQAQLDRLDLTADKEIIAYCQTHHRSALSWLALQHLGYPRAKGYPGAWSDWGNQPDTPIEQ